MLEAYNKTTYENDNAPPLDEVNLNNSEDGIEAVTNEAITLASRVTDLEAPAEVVIFTPQAVAPIPHTEGTLFYSEESKSLSYYNDIPDMTLNIGQEMVARIYNDTGATITNGQVVRSGGGAVGGVPTAILSIADGLLNASVGAVATHDIPNGTEGFATITGAVGGIDTSAWANGTRLYLSDTVAGGLTDVQPDVVSYAGFVLVSDPNDGILLVNPDSRINLPTVSGYLLELQTPTITVTATPQKFVNFAGSGNIVLDTDMTTGLLTAPNDGIYEAKTIIVIRDVTGSNDAQELDLYLRVNEGAVDEQNFPLIVGRSGTSTSGTPFFNLSLVEGDTVSLWYASDDINEAVTVSSISFSMTSLNIR